MADESTLTAEEPESGQRPGYTVLATVGLVLVAVIVILLFWRSCAADPAEDPQAAGGVIETVEGLDSVDGAVGVWVRPDASIDEVLARNGLSSAGVTDMGDGTYVIDIGDRDVEQTVNALAEDPGLYDAGYLFAEE